MITTRPHRPRRALIGATISGIFLLAACGGDDNNEPAPANTTEESMTEDTTEDSMMEDTTEDSMMEEEMTETTPAP